MKPLVVKKDNNKEIIVKSQILAKTLENESIENINNFENINSVENLCQIVEFIDNEIDILTNKKEMIKKKIKLLESNFKNNDDLLLITDIYNAGSFIDIKYEMIHMENNIKRFIFKKCNIENIQQSENAKQKIFKLRMKYINTYSTFIIKYNVDDIDIHTNTVVCENEICF